MSKYLVQKVQINEERYIVAGLKAIGFLDSQIHLSQNEIRIPAADTQSVLGYNSWAQDLIFQKNGEEYSMSINDMHQGAWRKVEGKFTQSAIREKIIEYAYLNGLQLQEETEEKEAIRLVF